MTARSIHRNLVPRLLIALTLCSAFRPAMGDLVNNRFAIGGAAVSTGDISRGGNQRFGLVGAVEGAGAGRHSSERFALQAGAPAFVSVIQTPGAPKLGLQLLPDGQALLTWPAESAGFNLQGCTDLSLGDWQPVLSRHSISGSTRSVTVPTSGQLRVFRLVKP